MPLSFFTEDHMSKEKKGLQELSKDDLENLLQEAETGLQAIGKLSSAALTRETAIPIWDEVQLAKKTAEAARETVRENIITFIQKNGKKAAEGGYFFQRGKRMVEMGGGGRGNVDPKKLMELLESKGKTAEGGKLEYYMDKVVTVSWQLNDKKLNKALEKGIITASEIEECKRPVPFSVQQVKEVEAEDE